MFSNYKISPEAMKFFKRGYESQMQGRLEEAVFYYRKSLLVEETAEGHTFLGWAYSFMGKFEEAIQECKIAILIDPDFGNPYNDIGSYLIQLHRMDEAIPWLEKAKKATRYETPEYSCYNLGRAYELLGLWPLAIREYQTALEINPSYPPAKMALKELKARMN